MTTNTCSCETDTEILTWNAQTLWQAAAALPVRIVPLAEAITPLDHVNWAYSTPRPGVWNDVHHAKRIFETDLSYPVILSSTTGLMEGALMDGAHRLAKAWILGEETVKIVQFTEDPEPDERRQKEPVSDDTHVLG